MDFSARINNQKIYMNKARHKGKANTLVASHESLLEYLVKEHFVAPAQIVDEEFVIEEAASRHQNFKVLIDNNVGYFIKVAPTFEHGITLSHECDIYRLLSSQEFFSFRKYLATLVHFDSNQQCLILELLRERQTAQSCFHSKKSENLEVWKNIGAALALLHRKSPAALSRIRGVQSSIQEKPWILSIARPQINALQHFSSATIELIKIIQSYSDFDKELARLSCQWTPHSLIHGDLRLSNILLPKSGQPFENSEIKIVDWELASVGDACWDIGFVLSEFLYIWVTSMPSAGGLSLNELMSFSRYPLSESQPKIHAFWASYTSNMSFTMIESRSILEKSVAFIGARLLQVACERMANSYDVSAEAILLLQLSLNILSRPTEAAIFLLGLRV